MRDTTACQGFTLVEVLVAIVVTAVVAVLATAVVGSGSDALGRLLVEAEAHQREMNGRRWLDQVIGNVDISAGGFVGDAHRARFSTRSWAGEGWLEVREVELRATGSGVALAIEGASGVEVLEGSASIEYLVPGVSGGRWLGAWESSSTAPSALRIVVRHPDAPTDSFLFFAGGRG